MYRNRSLAGDQNNYTGINENTSYISLYVTSDIYPNHVMCTAFWSSYIAEPLWQLSAIVVMLHKQQLVPHGTIVTPLYLVLTDVIDAYKWKCP